VGARLQVHGCAPGQVAGHRPAGDRRGEQLGGEGGQDHVRHGRLQCPAEEPAAERCRQVLADPVGLHAGLFEQPSVDRELPVGGVG